MGREMVGKCIILFNILNVRGEMSFHRDDPDVEYNIILQMRQMQ